MDEVPFRAVSNLSCLQYLLDPSAMLVEDRPRVEVAKAE